VFFYKRCLILIICLLLQACAQIDDYLLGKDNTLQPKTLPTIQSPLSLKECWSTSIGKSGGEHYLKLKPSIQGNTLYVADRRGKVMAYDKNKGDLLWSIALKQGIVSGPVSAHHVLALGTNNARLVVLDMHDGHELWQASVSSDILSSPLVTKNRVIVKTIDGRLYAFDLVTGKKLWSVNHGSPSLILRASSSPVKVHDWIIVGFSDGKMDAIDLKTGRIVWQRSIAYSSGSSDVERLIDIDADPVAFEDRIYLASYQGYIGAMSLQDGQVIWNKPASAYNNLNLDQNDIYMSDSHDVIWSISNHNGQVKWKQPALTGREITASARIGHDLFLGDKTGFLHVIDTQQGELVGRKQLNGSINVAPVVSEDHVYVLTAAGQLTCFSIGE
jgi:outer membrane protein assembly factor BamB